MVFCRFSRETNFWTVASPALHQLPPTTTSSKKKLLLVNHIFRIWRHSRGKLRGICPVLWGQGQHTWADSWSERQGLSKNYQGFSRRLAIDRQAWLIYNLLYNLYNPTTNSCNEHKWVYGGFMVQMKKNGLFRLTCGESCDLILWDAPVPDKFWCRKHLRKYRQLQKHIYDH